MLGLATSEFVPVCGKCGAEIQRVDFAKEIPIDGARGIAAEYRIEPECCEKCGAYFERIEIPTKLPYERKRSLTWEEFCRTVEQLKAHEIAAVLSPEQIEKIARIRSQQIKPGTYVVCGRGNIG